MTTSIERHMWEVIENPSADVHRRLKCASILCYFIYQLRGEVYRRALRRLALQLDIEDAELPTPTYPPSTAGLLDDGVEMLSEESGEPDIFSGDDDKHNSKQASEGFNESPVPDNGLEKPESEEEDAGVPLPLQSQHVDVASRPHLSFSGEDEDRSTRVPDGYIEYFDYEDDDAVPVEYARCDGFYRRLEPEPIAPPQSPQPPIVQGFSFPTPIPKDPEQYQRYIDALPAPDPDVPPVESVKACFGLETSSSHEIDKLLDAHGHHALTAMKALGHRLPEWADRADEELERYCDSEGLIRRNGAFQGVTISGNDIPTNLLVCKYQRGYGDGCRKADCHFSHNLAAHICKHWLSNPNGCVMKNSCPYSHNPYTAVVRGKEPDVPGNPNYPRNPHHQAQTRAPGPIQHPAHTRVPNGPSPTFTVATAVTDASRPTTATTAATNITAGTRDTTAPSTPYGKERVPAAASTAAVPGHDASIPSCAPREPAADRERRLQKQQQRPRPLMLHPNARQGGGRSGLSSAEGSRPSTGCEIGDPSLSAAACAPVSADVPEQGGEGKKEEEEEEEDMDAMFPPLQAAASVDTKAERRRMRRRNK